MRAGIVEERVLLVKYPLTKQRKTAKDRISQKAKRVSSERRYQCRY